MTFHARNRHQGRYDLPLLMKAYPALVPFVAPTEHGDLSIDFADAKAVKALNSALLIHYYGIRDWDIPTGYLCPPIPGRADYVHAIADLLAEANDGTIPQGKEVRGLDIGIGSNCIYPIIGHGEYGWSFVGTDVDTTALASADRILKANPELSSHVELRVQDSPLHYFKDVVQPGEHFDFTICNPPFHSSAEEAAAGSQRKWKNLGKAHDTFSATRTPLAPHLNFGGQGGELWCPGGEVTFISRMMTESREFADQILWFSSLLSKQIHLPAIEDSARRAGALDFRINTLTQGQKKSRIVAWTFRD